MNPFYRLRNLKRLLNKVKWHVEQERHEFIRRLNGFIRNWSQNLPNLREIFRPEDIECLLLDSINLSEKCMGEDFIEFVARTGYKDKPKYGEDGKPLLRCTTPLHHATRNNRRYLIPGLFKIYDRYDVNYTDEDGLTHFHVACRYGCDDVVEKFLELGQVDPNLLWSKTGDSPLHLADEREVIELLLRNGSDPNLANKEGLTRLHSLCQNKSDGALARIFLEINDEIGKTVQIDVGDKMGNTPLHFASRLGNNETLESLLRRGAKPILANEDGETSLHFISKREEDNDSMELFFKIIDEVQQTVPINAKNKFGNSPLHLAVAFQNIKAVQLLLRRGADPNLVNAEGLTPLQLIFQRYREGKLAEIFFDTSKEVGKLVNVDVRDHKGRTMLQLAVLNLLRNLLYELLENGADLSSFVFPTEQDFDEHFESYKLHKSRNQFKLYERIKSGFKLQVMSDAFDIIYSLGNRGCQLERSDALTIMKLFDKLGLFEMSEDLDKRWYNDEQFTEEAKKITITSTQKFYDEEAKKMITITSTQKFYDFMQLRPDTAAKIYTHRCHLMMRGLVSFTSPDALEAAHTKLGAALLRQFVQHWALGPFLKLMHYRLPSGICELILGQVTNRDLYNICLTDAGENYL